MGTEVELPEVSTHQLVIGNLVWFIKADLGPRVFLDRGSHQLSLIKLFFEFPSVIGVYCGLSPQDTRNISVIETGPTEIAYLEGFLEVAPTVESVNL